MLYCGKIEAYFHLERQGKKYMTNICIIATIIIYLVAMLLVGFAYSKSNNDSTDSTSAAAKWARWSRP